VQHRGRDAVESTSLRHSNRQEGSSRKKRGGNRRERKEGVCYLARALNEGERSYATICIGKWGMKNLGILGGKGGGKASSRKRGNVGDSNVGSRRGSGVVGGRGVRPLGDSKTEEESARCGFLQGSTKPTSSV